jgi:hypothetical protein
MTKKAAQKVMAAGVVVHCAHTDVVDVTKLIPNPRNPNMHPARQIELLGKVIRAQGWRAPITVSRRSGFVVRGHGRLQAALRVGLAEVPVDYQDYADEAAEWADLIADNRIAELAEMDLELLKEGLLLLKDSAFDVELAGFDAVEFDRLITDGSFYGVANDPAAEWAGMPAFDQKDKMAYSDIVMHFRCEEDVAAFVALIGQPITALTKYLQMERAVTGLWRARGIDWEAVEADHAAQRSAIA